MEVTDPDAFRPVEVGVWVVAAVYRQAPRGAHRSFFKAAWLANLAGTHRLRRALEDGQSPAEIVAMWDAEAAAFGDAAEAYRIYQ